MTVSKKNLRTVHRVGGGGRDERGEEERGNEGRYEREKETGGGRGHKEHINYLCAYSHG